MREDAYYEERQGGAFLAPMSPSHSLMDGARPPPSSRDAPHASPSEGTGRPRRRRSRWSSACALLEREIAAGKYQHSVAVDAHNEVCTISENLDVARRRRSRLPGGDRVHTHQFTFDHVYDQTRLSGRCTRRAPRRRSSPPSSATTPPCSPTARRARAKRTPWRATPSPVARGQGTEPVIAGGGAPAPSAASSSRHRGHLRVHPLGHIHAE